MEHNEKTGFSIFISDKKLINSLGSDRRSNKLKHDQTNQEDLTRIRKNCEYDCLVVDTSTGNHRDYFQGCLHHHSKHIKKISIKVLFVA